MKSDKLFSIHKSIFNLFSIVVIASMLAAGGSTSAAAKSSSPSEAPSLVSAYQQKMNQCLGTAGRTSTNPLTGKVNFAGASPNNPIQQTVQGLQTASPEFAARTYLSDCGSIFGLSGEANELSLTSARATGDGRNVVRFQQNFQGIPVVGGEVLMQLASNNNVILVNGSVLPKIKLNTQPSVDAATAQAAALQLTADQRSVSVDALKVSDAQLWIYSPKLIEGKDGPTSLVWRMEVTPVELAPIRELVLINAQDGSVALDINQVDTALNRTTYTANNTTTRPGTLVCNESNPNCTGGDTDAVNAHKFAGDTYNFYSSNHGRDSIDNAGMTLVSTVHFYTGYCNAFWDGFQMTYGDGCFIVADDVVAHELTHGVTEYSSNLFYAGQSGAMNESFSDIWGEFVDQTNGVGTDTPAVKWLMGEDTSIGALRDMKNPPAFGDPDRMSSYVSGGDVHINSGIGNKTAYLITDGDTFNGYTVTGLGITKTAKIYYEAQTNILISTSNYHSLYDALIQACNNLIGTAGIDSNNCQEVTDAVDATELDLLPLPPPAPANDDFASATVISTLPYTDSEDVSTATDPGNDPIFPYPSCTDAEAGTNSVWYDFTPTASGKLIVNTTGSDFDTVLGIWTGSGPGSLLSIGCNDDIAYPSNTLSSVAVPVIAGQTYHIEAAGYYGGGNLTLNVSLVPGMVTISPVGTITSKKPAFKWSQVSGATQYRFQLLKGKTVIYTTTVSSGACVGAICKNTPKTVLAYATYKWRAQAFVGGVWQAYSPYKTFTVSPPGFNSPFTNNAAGWTPLSGVWSVASGKYRVSGVANRFTTAMHSNNYPTLTYEVTMNRTGSCTGCVNSLYFRGTPNPLNGVYDWRTGYRFSYTNNGYMQLLYMKNGTYYTLLTWTPEAAIVQNGSNTLKVQANGTFIEFFINGTRVIYATFTGTLWSTTGNVGVGLYSINNSDKLYVDSAKLTPSVSPVLAIMEEGGISLNLSDATLNLAEGDPNIAP